MTTFAITTLGCKVNTYESQHYLEDMRQAGFLEVDFHEQADIYIINTCCVTNTAASKSRQKIHQAKKQNPSALVAIVGCYVQTIDPQVLATLQADVIIGAQGKGELVPKIKEALQNRSSTTNLLVDARGIRAFESLSVHAFSHQSRAFLKVQDGCNQFCSYCIIPYARGSERSIEPMEAVSIARQMVQNGHQEIVLSGIHTGRYGRDQGSSLLELLKLLIASTPDYVRYRISSIEMNEIDDAFIAYMQKEKRIARHLHIPIQAADDKVLQEMNRPYDVAWFAQRMQKIRQAIPNISISTDMIVGFPNESDAQFRSALKRVEEELRFSFIHCFPYSKRDHTPAAKMKGQIENKVKKQRVKMLGEVSQRLYHEFMGTFIGETLDIVLEEMKENMLFGHSSEYLPVYVQGATMPANKRMFAKVIGYHDTGLLAVALEGSL